MDQTDVPVHKDWHLNERHYGALQGLNKAETAEQYGAQQVHIWRRSYDVRPPALTQEDPRHPRFDPQYADMDSSQLPATESLKDTMDRVIPYWQDGILPVLHAEKKVIISAHGNSLRALVKHLDAISDNDISKLNIPTGIPLIYELDDDANAIKHYYLETPEIPKQDGKSV
jgi:2,3-bisphosphoglycerate-dependent phosphoglycerate mutase